MGCRSFLLRWTAPKTGCVLNAGRKHLGVILVNHSRIAMESMRDMHCFWCIFVQRMRICCVRLLTCIARTKLPTPDAAPILTCYGAFGHRLAELDSIADLFKNGRATVSLGTIGL